MQAFIGRRTTLEKIQGSFGMSRVVDLAQGLALLPLLDEFFDSVPDGPGVAGPSSDGFEFLAPKIGKLLVETSKAERDTLVYIETEYFGGQGVQGAITVKDGEVIFGPSIEENAINAALRVLGVRKISAHDEFDEVGLGRFRSNENWITQPRYGRE